MNYIEEKKYLVNKAINFMNGRDSVYLEDILGNTDYITLEYFGNKIECEAVGLEMFDDSPNEVFLRTYSEEYPDGAETDNLKYFSNDEIKKILDLFGIEY